MEDITEVKDIIQFILRADEIECDVVSGSSINIPYMIYHRKNFWILQKVQLHPEQKKEL